MYLSSLSILFRRLQQAPRLGFVAVAGYALSLLLLPSLSHGQSSPTVQLSVQLLRADAVQISWDAAYTNFMLEASANLGTNAGWLPLTTTPALQGGRNVITVPLDAVTRYFRLRLAPANTQFTVTDFEPSDGALDVGVTVRPKVTFSQSIDAATLTTNSLFASVSGQRLPAQIVPSNDGRFAWLFLEKPMPGGTRVQVTVDGSTIKAAGSGAFLDAAGQGTAGSVRQFSFTTVSLAPVPNTSLSGIVVDPGPDLIPRTADDLDAGPDGLPGTADDVFLLPIEGVQVHLIGREDQVLTTQADGRFHFDAVPVGDVKVVIDGTTATHPPTGIYFPEMVIDAQMLLGTNNWTMTNGPEIYLPRLSKSILQTVNASATNQVQATADGAPNLSAFQRSQLSINIPPGSLIGPDGKPLASGQVGISTVPADVVRDMLPPGVLQHTFDITVQAPGVATFSTPAPMSFPNVFNAAPGTKLNFLSFDHTTGRLVIEGTATVSADGASVVTDPGTGVTHPGWHGLTPPGGPSDPPCPPNQLRDQSGPPSLKVYGLQDYLFYNDGAHALVSFENDTFSSDPCRAPVIAIEVTVEGPSEEFMEGIPSHIVTFLEAGQILSIDFRVIDLLTDIKNVEVDRLYGIKVRVRAYTEDDLTNPLLDKTVYVYRFLDAADSDHGDGIISLPDTGTFLVRQRALEYHVAPSAMPTLKMDPSSHWSDGGLPSTVRFKPSAAGEKLQTLLHVLDPDGNEAGTLTLSGKGKDQTWYVDIPGFDQSIAAAITDQVVPGSVTTFLDTSAKRQAIVEQAAVRADSVLTGVFTSIRRVTSTSADASRLDLFYPNLNTNYLAHSDSVDFDHAKVADLLKNRSSYSHAEQNYRISRLLNQTAGADITFANKEILYNLYAQAGGTPSADQIAFDMGTIMAHEIGHTLGLPHTNDGKGKSVASNAALDIMDGSGVYPYNLQKFSLTGPPGEVALGDFWLPDTAQIAIDFYGKYYTAAGNEYFLRPSLPIDLTVSPAVSFNGAIAWIHQNDTNFVSGIWNMGEVLVDGPGGANLVQTFTLENLGDKPLNVASLAFLDAAPGFGLSAVPPGTTVAPGTNITFTITFDPARSGGATAHLRLRSDALAGDYDVDVHAFGRSPGADIRLLIPNNNMGGVAVGGAGLIATNFVTITNQGPQALQITSIKVNGGQNPNEFAVLGASVPLVVAPGQSSTFGVKFTPGKIGLRNAIIEIASNDPQTPLLHQMVVGTGLAASGSALDYGNDYVAFETPDVPNAPVLRMKSDADGNWSFFLPPQARYHWTIFDPVSGLVAHGFGITAASGDHTHISSPAFVASTAPDSDGDGLPDDIEFALGTDPHKVDTDGDGQSDFNDLALGLDPLGGRAFPTGVVAQLPLNGHALDVVVAAPASAAQQQTAYVTFGSSDTNGLAIVDVSQFQKPVLVAQAPLPTLPNGLAVDPDAKVAAVATGFGLYLIDLSNPTQPDVTGPVDGTLPATAVVIYNGAAYVGAGLQLAVVDLVRGTVVQTFPIGDAVAVDLAVEGHYLYLLDSNDALRVIDLAGGQMVEVGSLSLQSPGRRLAVGNGIAYLTSSSAAGGDSTIDISDPKNPRLITGPTQPSTTLAPGSAIALNGSGLAALVGMSVGVPVLDVLSTAQPTNTYAFITRYNLSAPPNGVALAGGIAYVADGTAGLVIANIVPFDTSGQPPSITIDASAADVDPNTAGIQVVEGSEFPVTAQTTDDVQVRNVDLLLNGQVVQTSVSFPFNLFGTAPLISRGGNTATVQARATDTGGNSALSSPITLQLLQDTVAPTLVAVDPPDGSQRDPGLMHVNVTFSEPLSSASAALSNFQLSSGGEPIPLTGVKFDPRRPTLQLSFAPLPAGDYQLSIHSAGISDRAGNLLAGPDIVSHFRLPAVPIIHFLGAKGIGLWMQPTNWDLGRVPGPGDTVVIEAARFASINPEVAILPTSLAQRFQQVVQVKNVDTEVNFGFDGVQFQATGVLKFDKIFGIGDGRLFETVLQAGDNSQIAVLGNFLDLPYLTGVWDDVTLNGNVSFFSLDNTGEALTLTNRLTLNGTLSGGTLAFVGPATIDGTGQLLNMTISTVATDSNTGDPIAWPASSLTLGSNIVAQGQFTVNLAPNTTLLNLGFLSALQPGTPFSVTADPQSSGAFTNSGTIHLGPANVFQSAPDYHQTSAGHLVLEVGGTNPGHSYGQLQVTGPATLAGELKITLAGTYQPRAGDSFDVVLYSASTGQFDNITLPPLPSGLSWKTSANPDRFTVSIGQP